MIGYNNSFGEDGNIAEGKTISEVVKQDGIVVGEAVNCEFDEESINIIWGDDSFKQLVFEQH